jgi:hypothetical protein
MKISTKSESTVWPLALQMGYSSYCCCYCHACFYTNENNNKYIQNMGKIPSFWFIHNVLCVCVVHVLEEHTIHEPYDIYVQYMYIFLCLLVFSKSKHLYNTLLLFIYFGIPVLYNINLLILYIGGVLAEY